MNKFAIGCGGVSVIIAFFAVVAGLGLMGSYNRLVKLQQSVDQSWAQVQNVYQRRADLIPNLVNTVSGAANFEKSNFIAVMFGFAPRPFFAAQPGAERAPAVNFNFGTPAASPAASPAGSP